MANLDKTDEYFGLYDKFVVDRVDGSSNEGGRHFGCDYFVLDLTHDPHSIPAIKAYADSCEKKFPILASDLRKAVGS